MSSFTLAAQADAGGNLVSQWLEMILFCGLTDTHYEFSTSFLKIILYIKCFILFLSTDRCRYLTEWPLYYSSRGRERLPFLSLVICHQQLSPSIPLQSQPYLNPLGKSTATQNHSTKHNNQLQTLQVKGQSCVYLNTLPLLPPGSKQFFHLLIHYRETVIKAAWSPDPFLLEIQSPKSMPCNSTVLPQKLVILPISLTCRTSSSETPRACAPFLALSVLPLPSRHFRSYKKGPIFWSSGGSLAAFTGVPFFS